MKTIVLMGVSCLMLAGVYGVMNKESAVSKILSFNQAQGATSPIDTGDKDKTNKGLTTEHADHKSATSKTLDDSHWIDDPLFEKAVGSDLITDNEVDVPQVPSNPEGIKQAAPHKEAVPEAKQLILELDADSAVRQKVPVESI
ncbi:hypothetical protein A4H97_01300 [Niastella yeongjuensis]|uniref:Uncharacterized protein n=1 Tax=Niastella yeongjuensis TaxID=354355 RepID=A0A1V9EX94_9BACT|nr:hypothetical protein [Niastella yeongjuensis]OQP50504.1 hypothetical protein A4H97_01300 [Niastella yeongjuensis]SEN31462.1 hypothetical protein SAMN05660816_00685 [Niastella yeongjuensis]